MKDTRPVPRSASAARYSGELDDEQRTQVRRALVFIEDNLGSALAVADIARVACYGPRHFQRLFQSFTGESVHDYIRRMRVDRAVVLLRRERMNVTDAALIVGFSNPSGLYKAFQQRFGCAPADFLAAPAEPPAVPE
jgi:AraC family transcriptional regulator